MVGQRLARAQQREARARRERVAPFQGLDVGCGGGRRGGPHAGGHAALARALREARARPLALQVLSLFLQHLGEPRDSAETQAGTEADMSLRRLDVAFASAASFRALSACALC